MCDSFGYWRIYLINFLKISIGSQNLLQNNDRTAWRHRSIYYFCNLHPFLSFTSHEVFCVQEYWIHSKRGGYCSFNWINLCLYWIISDLLVCLQSSISFILFWGRLWRWRALEKVFRFFFSYFKKSLVRLMIFVLSLKNTPHVFQLHWSDPMLNEVSVVYS